MIRRATRSGPAGAAADRRRLIHGHGYCQSPDVGGFGRDRRGGERMTPRDPDAQISALVRDGWRIENDDGRYVFMVRGQRVNHLLHFIVGFLTLGLWWVVWLILALTGGEKRKTIIRPQ